jgi:hypothetical protein
MQKTTRFNMFYAVIAVVGVLILHDLLVSYQADLSNLVNEAARVKSPCKSAWMRWA